MKTQSKKTLKSKIKWHFAQFWKLLFFLLFCSCGMTKVAVQKPAEGTSTTITVTTNNPITTNLPVDADVKLK